MEHEKESLKVFISKFTCQDGPFDTRIDWSILMEYIRSLEERIKLLEEGRRYDR